MKAGFASFGRFLSKYWSAFSWNSWDFGSGRSIVSNFEFRMSDFEFRMSTLVPFGSLRSFFKNFPGGFSPSNVMADDANVSFSGSGQTLLSKNSSMLSGVIFRIGLPFCVMLSLRLVFFEYVLALFKKSKINFSSVCSSSSRACEIFSMVSEIFDHSMLEKWCSSSSKSNFSPNFSYIIPISPNRIVSLSVAAFGRLKKRFSK